MNAANALRRLIRSFDTWLSRRLQVYPFSDAEGIILRIQRGKAPYDLHLPDGRIPRGAPVLLLHLWNERLPVPPEGHTLAWATIFRRQIRNSLCALAQHLQQTRDFSDILALGGSTAHLTLEHPAAEKLLLHLGFSIFPYSSPVGRFGEFWENFYTWWLIWAYNPESASRHPMWKLRRVSFWIERRAFIERYAR
ncbi:MAG: hypothetical protein WHS87_00070 [Anaerolineales bacterium]